MTRSQLVWLLRSLHESDTITFIRTNLRRKSLEINYTTTSGREGQLITPFNATTNTKKPTDDR